jgi:hypothetical protein
LKINPLFWLLLCAAWLYLTESLIPGVIKMPIQKTPPRKKRKPEDISNIQNAPAAKANKLTEEPSTDMSWVTGQDAAAMMTGHTSTMLPNLLLDMRSRIELADALHAEEENQGDTATP